MTTPNTSSTSQTTRKSRKKRGVGCLALILALLAIIAAGYIFLLPRFAASRHISQPVVQIYSPQNGDQLITGQTAILHASASGANKINRIEFWVDDQMQSVERSANAAGAAVLPLVEEWRPASSGVYRLAVRAFDAAGERAYAYIDVEVAEATDGDGDGAPDARDACPDQPGSPLNAGCPQPDDRDNDGVVDTEDACPDERGHRDGDGCPTPGDSDGDSVADADDACPDEPGAVDVDGCPDRDEDSVPDAEDADPDMPGPPEADGGPDRDGDGVPDADDLRPEEPGSPEAGGAPAGPDRDGDGAPDDADPCPDEAGPPENDFCPAPDEDSIPLDPLIPALPSLSDLFAPMDKILVQIELQAYEFWTSGIYDSAWCYAQVGDTPIERYDFPSHSGHLWSIGRVLAGANALILLVDDQAPLAVHLDCWGRAGDDLHYLGYFQYAHPSSDWDGRELIANASDGDDAFSARYRICSPSCEEYALPRPILSDILHGPAGNGPYQLRWSWHGDEHQISSFILQVNGVNQGSHQVRANQRTIDISDFKPACGERTEFRIQALSSDGADSPTSNPQYWDGIPCQRTVAITFESYEPNQSFFSREGIFYANDNQLRAAGHSASDPSYHAYGALFSAGRTYPLDEFFQHLMRHASICTDEDGPSLTLCDRGDFLYYAPTTTTIIEALGPDESLTIGSKLWGGYGLHFSGELTIPPEHIRAGLWELRKHGDKIIVRTDILASPELGGEEQLPDLSIAEIAFDDDMNRYAITVLNNGAALSHQNINIAMERIGDEEALGVLSWPDVSIPAAGRIILQQQPHHPTLEPRDLRAIIDPDNTIAEFDEENNTYEMPVRVRVQFTRIGLGEAPCESILNIGHEAEHVFFLWAGYTDNDGVFVPMRRFRYPPGSGTADVGVEQATFTDLGWSMPDDYAIKFDLPRDRQVVISAAGFEDDLGRRHNDYLGDINAEFGPEDNYGDSPRPYHEFSTHHSCQDTGAPPGEHNFHFWWQITRLH